MNKDTWVLLPYPYTSEERIDSLSDMEVADEGAKLLGPSFLMMDESTRRLELKKSLRVEGKLLTKKDVEELILRFNKVVDTMRIASQGVLLPCECTPIRIDFIISPADKYAKSGIRVGTGGVEVNDGAEEG